jgi:hypothetical protein
MNNLHLTAEEAIKMIDILYDYGEVRGLLDHCLNEILEKLIKITDET